MQKKTNEINWAQMQTIAFETLKKILRNKPKIKVFDAQKEVTLTTDSSEKVIAILSQEHPIMHMSRTRGRTTQYESNQE